MSPKILVYFGLFLGSLIGGVIPLLWEKSLLSYSSVLFSAIGGILGIILVVNLMRS